MRAAFIIFFVPQVAVLERLNAHWTDRRNIIHAPSLFCVRTPDQARGFIKLVTPHIHKCVFMLKLQGLANSSSHEKRESCNHIRSDKLKAQLFEETSALTLLHE